MTQKELDVILEKHEKWLNKEIGGKRADLSSADLRGANLSYANLEETNLIGADLGGANLKGANLKNANLLSVNLACADLTDADLFHAKLCFASLKYADLKGANLEDVDLSHVNLCFTNLKDACLTNANLNGANLRTVDLNCDEKIRKGICLKEPIIGYKKCRHNVIVTLEIPKGAIVFSINNSKCRTNIAKVIDIDGDLDKAVSDYNDHFFYCKGEMVYPDDFNCMYNVECAEGIHFFRTREEAENY